MFRLKHGVSNNVAVCLVWQLMSTNTGDTMDVMPSNFSFFDIDSDPASQPQIRFLRGTPETDNSVTNFFTGTQFKLYNDKATNLDITTNEDAIEKFLDTKKPIKFVVHGFIDSTGVTWMHDMAAELVVKTQSNVIVVDWHSKFTYTYLLINHMVNKVAEQIKEFICTHKLPPEHTHLIGHSLGAHVAGFVGKSIAAFQRTKNISRITGLDPAWPGFFLKGPADRLHHTDADFVDVIHTSSLDYSFKIPFTHFPAYPRGLGLDEPVGHIDFYPNDGRKQPGCVWSNLGMHYRRRRGIISEPWDALMEAIYAFMTKFAACNHFRSIQLFTESLAYEFQTDCQFISCGKDSYSQFKRDGCKDGLTNKMGYLATKPRHPPGFRYYLATNGEPKYCNDKPSKLQN